MASSKAAWEACGLSLPSNNWCSRRTARRSCRGITCSSDSAWAASTSRRSWSMGSLPVRFLIRPETLRAMGALTCAGHRLRLIPMEFKISELEKEPIDFDLRFKAGVINFGDEAEQSGALETSGRAEVLHEHRGPKEIVADIRLRGQFAGKFEVPCARCVEPVGISLASDFDLIFRPVGADA